LKNLVLLRSVDSLWMDHLDSMDYLRDSVRLRAYGQKDPLIEYKNEGIKLFQQLLASIQSTIVNTIYKVALAPDNAPASKSISSNSDKIGRNSPCPCGSGLKYKKCCGK